MPYDIQIEPESGIAISQGTGVLGLNDALASAQALWSNPEWGGRVVVWDFRSAQFRLTTPEIREFAEFVLQHQPKTPPAKVAIVTGRDVDFGMARMFEVFRSRPSTEIQVFRDYDQALTWARSEK